MPPGNKREGFNTLTAGDMVRYRWAIQKREIEFQTRLGAGAYGEVWAGQWRRNDVAIKSLHVSESLSEDDKNNFLEEMSLVRARRVAGRTPHTPPRAASLAPHPTHASSPQPSPARRAPLGARARAAAPRPHLAVRAQLSELRHPNIVRFLGACLEASNMCILFELCPGSLFDLLHKSAEPLPATDHMV